MPEKKEKKQSSADEKEAQAWNKTLQKRMKAAREAGLKEIWIDVAD